MKNSRLASWKTALPFLLPSLAGFVVFSIIPMIMQIFVSLTSWDGLSELTLFSDFSGFMDRFYVGIENYKEILTSKEFYQVIGNTLEFVILYIPLMLIASMIVALILNSHVKGVGIFRVLYYIPVITSWVAGALIWKWVLSPEYGAINNILALFGIEGPSWLQSSKWAMPAIVLASVWKDMGYFGLMADGAWTVLEKLHAVHIPMAIGSSSKNTPLIVEKLGIGKFFDAIVDGNQISHSKPDPEVFLLAAEKLHQKPSDCLVVEDAEAGVKAALNGGFLVAGIGPAKDCPNVNYPLLSLSELLAVEGHPA